MIQRSRQASHCWLGRDSRIGGGGTGAKGIAGIAFFLGQLGVVLIVRRRVAIENEDARRCSY